MGRPRKDAVKVNKVKAKKNTTKKVKDSFLKIGERYDFYINHAGNITGRLLNATKTEYLILEEDERELAVIRAHLIHASIHGLD